jgi:hypothetical protein
VTQLLTDHVQRQIQEAQMINVATATSVTAGTK